MAFWIQVRKGAGIRTRPTKPNNTIGSPQRHALRMRLSGLEACICHCRANPTRGQCGAAAGSIMAWARGGALAPAFARGPPPRGAEGPARLATTAAPTKGEALSGSVLRLMARSTPLVRFAGSKSQPAASEKGKGPLVGRVPLCHAAPYPCPWCQAASAENPFSCGEKPSPVLII